MSPFGVVSERILYYIGDLPIGDIFWDAQFIIKRQRIVCTHDVSIAKNLTIFAKVV